MKHFRIIVLFFTLTLAGTVSALAADLPLMLATADGSISIISPANDAVLSSGSGNKLKYNITLSPNGNHIHVYVDNMRPIIDRKVSGCPCSLDLPNLSAGEHTIVMKEATAGHSLTGLETSVSVTVK